MPESWVKLELLGEPEYETNKGASDHHDVWVQDFYGVRAMVFNGDHVQSSMKVGKPHELAGEYTRCMMAFLLFHPRPQRIVMIGLGGGSLAKFIYYEMPDASITIVEVNPKVVAAARSHFHLPRDDERLPVVIAEGGRYVAAHRATADVLIVDGFDANGQAPSLCTQSFYDDCFAALRPGGILVVNLLGDDESTDVYLQRIQASFGDTVLTIRLGEDGNVVVFGFQDAQPPRRNDELVARAQALKAMYELAFPLFVRTIKRVS